MKIHKMLLCVGLFLFAHVTMMGQAIPPEGNVGIAAKYPGDLGIENDPDVILAEGFENYSQMRDLRSIWATINEDHMNLTTDSENVIGGKQALQLNLPFQFIERYTGIDLHLTEEQKQDVIYIRYYQKIDKSYAVSGGTSNHNGGCISSRYWTTPVGSGPGYCANGTNKYLAMLQNSPSAHYDGYRMGIYTYHPDQRYNDIPPVWIDKDRPATAPGNQYADFMFPDGEVLPWTYWRGNYGSDFIPHPNFSVEMGRWYCYEFMLKANTPGLRDGRLTAWIDGEVIMDFGNMRFRDIADLKIDMVGFSFGCASNPVATKSWFDNIVIAKSYIGPIYNGSQVNNHDIAAEEDMQGYLHQNVPNPFPQSTEIKFYIPENVKTAQLSICNILGKQIMQIPINQRGKGLHRILASELTTGMYFYTLIFDGKPMDTKQMILIQ